MKTQKQFIIDTLMPYVKDPNITAYEGYACLYLAKDGRKCAVGMHLKNKDYFDYEGSLNSMVLDYMCSSDKIFSYEEALNNLLTKEAFEQKLPINVWDNIQHYHDEIANYNQYNSITPIHLESLNRFVENIEERLNIDLKELKFELN